ncbi:MAG: hypothetical protein K2O54_06535, partial [Prevotella sp.]|nr:hypothetical protein [Prevotella sp.]
AKYAFSRHDDDKDIETNRQSKLRNLAYTCTLDFSGLVNLKRIDSRAFYLCGNEAKYCSDLILD